VVFSKEEARWQKIRRLKLLNQIIKSVKEFIVRMLQNLKMDIKQSTEVKGVNLLILRDTFTEISTIGNLYLNGEWLCDTLELPYKDNQRSISSIPAGKYKVRLRTARESATRDYLHLLVQDVPNRDYILVHIGNKSSDSRGCVLVGIGTEQDFVKNSRLAMELLMKEVLNLGGTNINLIIKNK
jgi:hypothetical protein